jgi:predicted nucleic acid-binding protein
MVRQETAPRIARRGKGKKRTKKKEAVVTAIYTIAPYERTPEAVADRLMRELTEKEEEQRRTKTASSRPAPVGKEVRATLYGKNTAFERLVRRVARREGPHIQHYVALTDGDNALQSQIEDRLSRFTLVLDIIHVSEYLWGAANALLGEKHPDRNAWVKERLLLILSDKTEAVIQDLESHLQTASLSEAQRDALIAAIRYYRRNLPSMHYGTYLARGWPIGTGVVEGACGHLVKDRMERSGMRWTKAGAQAILALRAVRINDDWDAYQTFHRQCQHLRLYNRPLGAIPAPELFTRGGTVPEAEVMASNCF